MGEKQNKKIGGGNIYIYISQGNAEYFFLVGYTRKYTNGYLWGQSLGKAFNFHLLLFPYLPCTYVGNGLMGQLCFLLHTLLYTHIHTNMHTYTNMNIQIMSKEK